MPTVNAFDFPVEAAILIDTNLRDYVEFGLAGSAADLDRRVVPVEFAIDLVVGYDIAHLGAVVERSVACNHNHKADRVNLESTLCVRKPVEIKRYVRCGCK